jgi:NodT family efflux transporter outer membrane factor (OMF) lipoprotein
VLITACSCKRLAGPEYQPPSAPEKQQWTQTTGAANSIRPDWWREFNDPQLTALVEGAIAGNLDLAVAAGRVERAEAVIQQVRAGRRPALTLNAGATANVQGADGGQTASYETYQTGAGLSWEIDLWGKLRKGVDAAQADYRAAGAGYRAAYLVLAADTATVYLDLRRLDDAIDVYEKNVATTSEMLKLYQAQAEEDYVGQDVVLRQQAELRRLNREQEDARRERQILQNALATLVGKPAGELNIPTADTSKTLEPVPVPLILPAELLKRRPDIMAAEYRVLAAYNLLGKARLERLPSISLSASGGTASPSVTNLLAQWLIGAGPSITIPILNSGVKAEINVREADYKIAEDTYRAAVIRAFQEVEDALTNQASYQRQRLTAQRELDELRKVRAITVAKVEEGLAPQLELLESDRSLLRSEQTLNAVRFNQLRSCVDLFKALGGGWTADDG